MSLKCVRLLLVPAFISLLMDFASATRDRFEEEVDNWMESANEVSGEASGHSNSMVDLSLNQAINFDENLTQLPDGEISVSDQDGGQSTTTLNFAFHKIPKKKEKVLKVQLDLGNTRYFDKGFATRNSQNVTFGINKPFEQSKKSKFLGLSIKALFRTDLLYAFGKKEKAFETLTVGVLGVFKPIKAKKKKFADIYVPAIGLDIESRDFKQAYGVDGLGNSKDSLTPSALLIFMAMKKYKRFSTQSMFMMNIRNTISDSKDSEYLSIRTGLTYTLKFKKFNLIPDVSVTIRDQKSYQNAARDDTNYATGLAYQRIFNKKKTSLKAHLKYNTQTSNLTAFKYNNTGISISGKHKF